MIFGVLTLLYSLKKLEHLILQVVVLAVHLLYHQHHIKLHMAHHLSNRHTILIMVSF